MQGVQVELETFVKENMHNISPSANMIMIFLNITLWEIMLAVGLL